MEQESLGKLKAAFEEWRSKKRHAREAIPAELVERAWAAARRHGVAAVHQATKVEERRLKTGQGREGGGRAPEAVVPAFSRVELAGLSATPLPFAEVEMPSGFKLRLFTQNQEVFELLSSLCDKGGGR